MRSPPSSCRASPKSPSLPAPFPIPTVSRSSPWASAFRSPPATGAPPRASRAASFSTTAPSLALAQLQEGFDWREEAWETLTHEVRHHLEWRARAPTLEAFDRAVEQNFARQDGEPFDPLFFLDGEPAGDDAYSVEDDVFLDRVVDALPASASVQWRGRAYRIPLPTGAELPAFLTLEGVADSPEGDLVLVLRRKPGLRDLIRRPAPFQATVTVVEVYFSPDSADSSNR